MNISRTEYKYIQLDREKTPIIAGTRMKIVELIAAVKAYGWSPEELHFQYPHLSMSQIYSALAYYWDHREEMDVQIEQRFQSAERQRLAAGVSPFVARMRTEGLLK